MPRLQALVAWCCGTAVSAGIAWFGVAGAVDSAVSHELRIAVPARQDVTPSSTAGPTPSAAPATSPRRKPSATADSATGGRPDRTTSASDGPTGDERGRSVIARTVRGGSATFSVQPTGVTLLSATPASGYIARIRRQYSFRNGDSTGTLEVRFEGSRRTSSITVTWKNDDVDVTTSNG